MAGHQRRKNTSIHIGTRRGYACTTKPFSLNVTDLYQHAWLNGQTGVGKSALLRSMLAQIIAHGYGCTFIDYNGDLADEVLDYIPLSRRNDVISFDPADKEHVLPINPFYQIAPDDRHLVATNFVRACRDIWADSWGERMNWILLNATKATLHAPDELRPTVLSIPMLLIIDHYRKAILKHVDDPEVLHFFRHQFERYSPKERSLFIIPIENKIGQIISNPYIRNALSPYKPTFQLHDAIAQRKILIIKLSKGTLGEDPAQLLGALSVSTTINAALAQAALPYDQRVPHFLIIDEQHNLKTTAPKSAYAELRKYKCGIISSTQYTDQMPDSVLKSMFGNIGTIISFRSSPTDARRFSEQLVNFPEDEFTHLRRGEVRVRALRNGSPELAFPATTSIDHVPPHNKRKQILKYVRERYTRPRSEVEHNYTSWLRKMMIDPANRKRRQQDDTFRRHQRAPMQTPAAAQPLQDTMISKRGEIARKQIAAIVSQAGRKAGLPTRYKRNHRLNRRPHAS